MSATVQVVGPRFALRYTWALNLRSHHPVLIDAGFPDLEVPIPW